MKRKISLPVEPGVGLTNEGIRRVRWWRKELDRQVKNNKMPKKILMANHDYCMFQKMFYQLESGEHLSGDVLDWYTARCLIDDMLN